VPIANWGAACCPVLQTARSDSDSPHYLMDALGPHRHAIKFRNCAAPALLPERSGSGLARQSAGRPPPPAPAGNPLSPPGHVLHSAAPEPAPASVRKPGRPHRSAHYEHHIRVSVIRSHLFHALHIARPRTEAQSIDGMLGAFTFGQRSSFRRSMSLRNRDTRRRDTHHAEHQHAGDILCDRQKGSHACCRHRDAKGLHVQTGV
jgi:hypothetical protein